MSKVVNINTYTYTYISIYRYVELCLNTIFIKNKRNFSKRFQKGKNKELKIIIPNAESKKSQIDERDELII